MEVVVPEYEIYLVNEHHQISASHSMSRPWSGARSSTCWAATRVLHVV
jgi:hypothetical protein